jgi:hypothetical protein
VLQATYSNCTWQNHTFDAAKAVARGDRGRMFDWGMSLGLFGYTEQENTNGHLIPKTALQYIENHDHERFLCNFGVSNPDEAGNPLFLEGDRNLWYMLQPYLIAISDEQRDCRCCGRAKNSEKIIFFGFRRRASRRCCARCGGIFLRYSGPAAGAVDTKAVAYQAKPRADPPGRILFFQRLAALSIPWRAPVRALRRPGIHTRCN